MSQTGTGAGATTARGEGHVRLRRFSLLAVPATLAGAALVVLTASGVLAAQFSISGMPFTVTADQLTGDGLEQYGGIDNAAPGSPNLQDTNGQELVFVSAIRQAELTNLCQSVSIGFTNLVIRAGQGSSKVQATNLVVDSDQLSGDASFTNMSIDQDASTLTEVPGVTGPLGTFGQQADTVSIKNLRQENWATTASSFTLPGLSIGFSDSGC
ncbi:MAG TPA: DUF6230 family protein [Actinospica sp.]|jgi:hypothetical protein|nr:DUF6230 family protein [Actinospica sp.]